jgi:regulator of protease activity HflC (stomatin/prohibitin superfamily)
MINLKVDSTEARTFFWSVMLIALGLFVTMAILTWGSPIGDMPLTFGFLWLLLLLVGIAANWKEVRPDEIGLILFFGMPLFHVGSGPVFSLWPIFELVKEKRSYVYQTHEDKYWTAPSPAGSRDAADKQMLITTGFLAIYQIDEEGGLARIIQKFGNWINFQKNFHELIHKLLWKEISERTAQQARAETRVIDKNLTTAAMKEAGLLGSPAEDSWGIKENVKIYMNMIRLPDGISLAQESVAEAELERIRKEILAEGEASWVIKVETAKYHAKATGYKEIAKALNMEEKELIAILDHAKDIFSGKINFGLVSGTNFMGEIVSTITAINAMGKNLKV